MEGVVVLETESEEGVPWTWVVGEQKSRSLKAGIGEQVECHLVGPLTAEGGMVTCSCDWTAVVLPGMLMVHDDCHSFWEGQRRSCLAERSSQTNPPANNL